jgi:Flp pilus assembly protein TadD
MKTAILIFALALAAAAQPPEWKRARDAQDRAALDKFAAASGAQAQAKANDAQAQYMAAVAELYRAEVDMELKDKNAARASAENGIKYAEKSVALNPKSAEYHRVLGTLCGQVIPANLLAGMKYGKCALDEVNTATELDPKSSDAWMSRGVGNYYLPPSFGGGPEIAVKDLEKATQLNPKNSDAWMWLGITLRKLNRNAEARQAFTKSLALNPQRAWARQQLEKTPAQ